jgi:hypothetical protein
VSAVSATRPEAEGRKTVETGLILLAFLAAIFTIGFSRVRRKMGLGMTSKHWLIGFVTVFLLILVVWANGHT